MDKVFNLESVLAKFDSLEFDETSGEVVWRAKNMRAEEVALLKSVSNNTEPDLSAYFAAISQSPMYKPANPLMAVQQVAKHYGLDAAMLGHQFKSSIK